MTEPEIWIVHAEVAPREGADAPDWCEGAFVACYVAADDITDAVARARMQLDAEHYDVTDVSQALRYDKDDYEEDDEVHQLAREAQEAGGEVVYGAFEAWSSEDEGAGEA